MEKRNNGKRLFDEAKALFIAGDEPKAKHLFEAYLNVREKEEDRADYFKAFKEISDFLTTQGSFGQAFEFSKRGFLIVHREQASYWYLSIYSDSMCEIAERGKMLEWGLEELKNILEILENGDPQSSGIREITTKIKEAYIKLGKVEEGINYLKQVFGRIAYRYRECSDFLYFGFSLLELYVYTNKLDECLEYFGGIILMVVKKQGVCPTVDSSWHFIYRIYHTIIGSDKGLEYIKDRYKEMKSGKAFSLKETASIMCYIVWIELVQDICLHLVKRCQEKIPDDYYYCYYRFLTTIRKGRKELRSVIPLIADVHRCLELIVEEKLRDK